MGCAASRCRSRADRNRSNVTRIDDPRTLDDLLEKAVISGVLPGVVALVATTEGILYEASFGVRDIHSGAPITPDTIFGIASMTKSLTAVAVLQLVERRLVALSQPVGEICRPSMPCPY